MYIYIYESKHMHSSISISDNLGDYAKTHRINISLQYSTKFCMIVLDLTLYWMVQFAKFKNMVEDIEKLNIPSQ